jgi:ATP:ADP antiporter, AAA family
LSATAKPYRPTPLQRLLNLITEVRPGEAGPALVLFATIFLVLCAYYFIKPVREGWLSMSVIAGLSKIEIKAYSSFVQAVILLAAIPFYAWLTTRLPRRELISRVGLFFAANMLIFWLLHPGFVFTLVPYLGTVFYIWTGIFAVTLVAQFWSFAVDLYGEERGKRLFPLIALGASSGAVVGSWLSEQLVTDMAVEVFDLLLIATIPLLVALVLARWVDHHGVTTHHAGVVHKPQAAAPGDTGAYTLILRTRYLRLTALMVFAMFWVLTNGENILFALIQRALATEGAGATVSKTFTTNFYSNLYFWINLTGLLMQAFLVSRLQRWGGFGALMLVPPLVSLVGYGAMAAESTLAVVAAAKTAENSTNYSINNTARQVLWLPTTKEMIYKAKAAIDTLCVRCGDGLAALTVLIGTRVFQVDVEGFILFNMILIGLWSLLAVLVVREHYRLLNQPLHEAHE